MHRGYTILENFGTFDDDLDPDIVKKKRPAGLRGGYIHEMFDCHYSTFPGERTLRTQKNRTLWNPIIQSREPGVDKLEDRAGKSRCTSTINLVT